MWRGRGGAAARPVCGRCPAGARCPVPGAWWRRVGAAAARCPVSGVRCSALGARCVVMRCKIRCAPRGENVKSMVTVLELFAALRAVAGAWRPVPGAR